MPRQFLRLRRRALVVLAWLMLAVAVVPAAQAQPVRVVAAFVCTAAGTGVAAPPARTVARVRLASAVRRGAARAHERAALVSPLANAGAQLARTERSWHEPQHPRLEDGRHLYLSNCSLLC